MFDKVFMGLTILLFVCSPTFAAVQSPGDLTVTPTRVVFEGRARTQQISLINRGAERATFRLSFARLRMGEAGGFEEVSQPLATERFADPLVRFSPRQVTLEPGQAQVVRLMVRKPSELEAGEYRSHLVLQAVPPEEAGFSLDEESLASDELGIRLIPVFRITVPVIVRHGADLKAETGFADLSLQPATEEAPPQLSLRLERTGKRSVYGDVLVRFVPEEGESVMVGQIKGLAVYAPNAARELQLPLRLPDGVELRSGRLAVAFAEPSGPHGVAKASAELPLS